MTKEEQEIKEYAGLLMDLYTVMRQTEPKIQDFYDISKELLLKFNSSKSTLKYSVLHIVEQFHKRTPV